MDFLSKCPVPTGHPLLRVVSGSPELECTEESFMRQFPQCHVSWLWILQAFCMSLSDDKTQIFIIKSRSGKTWNLTVKENLQTFAWNVLTGDPRYLKETLNKLYQLCFGGNYATITVLVLGFFLYLSWLVQHPIDTEMELDDRQCSSIHCKYDIVETNCAAESLFSFVKYAILPPRCRCRKCICMKIIHPMWKYICCCFVRESN